jgi:hypothetical protein
MRNDYDAIVVGARIAGSTVAALLGSPPLVRQYVYPGGAAFPTVEPPQDPGAVGYCLSVRREPLDALLPTSSSEIATASRHIAKR